MTKEKPTTKICKYCKTEIPYDAKVCPQCRKKLKGGIGKWIFLGIAAIIVIAAIAGGSGKSDNETKKIGTVTDTAAGAKETQTEKSAEKKTETEQSAETEAPQASVTPAQTEYRVGDILLDGKMKIVYMASGEYAEENSFLQPDEGNRYIFLKFYFENTSDSTDDSISSFSFSCYADGYSAESYYGGDEDLSATLSAGRSTVGCVYFEVPKDAETVEVEYETNYFTEEKINFIYEGDQDSGFVPPVNTKATTGAYSVGDVVESSKLKITYLSCAEYISDNMFIQPKSGNHFILCEFEFENLGSSDEFVSYYDFDCYADGQSCEARYFMDDALSATISAGRKTKGTVAFEVPLDATVVEVEYLSNYWTSNRVVFSAK